jgi:hypothetical protein
MGVQITDGATHFLFVDQGPNLRMGVVPEQLDGSAPTITSGADNTYFYVIHFITSLSRVGTKGRFRHNVEFLIVNFELKEEEPSIIFNDINFLHTVDSVSKCSFFSKVEE